MAMRLDVHSITMTQDPEALAEAVLEKRDDREAFDKMILKRLHNNAGWRGRIQLLWGRLFGRKLPTGDFSGPEIVFHHTDAWAYSKIQSSKETAC